MADYSEKDPYAQLVRDFQAERDPNRTLLADAMREIERFICKKWPTLRHESGELIQDTITRAYVNARSFKWESMFMTWVKGIALNVVREHCRRRDNQNMGGADNFVERQAADIDADNDTDPEDQALRGLLFEEAVAQLDLEEKRAVQLRFTDEGLTPFKDIGDLCGISSVDAQRLVYRALRKIKRHWTENDW